ncbi:hypothetical protein Goshw_015157 [Gossypium schwendimanii]|uniref:Ribulose-1,5-bisphosphate carboxylase/oxygenase large subunit n=1 Tax=Gossypium schwendimanii TaxID=34291 RepID=A0A7J9LG34_GOSSC|nr:hypothetical protein [Gossypium schwendimanii]
MSCREGLMSPQIETKASVGFKLVLKSINWLIILLNIKSKIRVSWQPSE